jgi:hypothetical protein
MGTGIILMTRKQMLHIKELVEKPAQPTEEIEPTASVEPEPSLAS